MLCNKLRQFPYEDIEFFLPQLCHLIISVDNESMALEEFLLDLCEESVTAALLVREEARGSGTILTMDSRHSGYSRPIFTIFPRIPSRAPSKRAVASTIKSSTSSLDSPTPVATTRSRKMFSPSRSYPHLSSRVWRCR